MRLGERSSIGGLSTFLLKAQESIDSDPIDSLLIAVGRTTSGRVVAHGVVGGAAAEAQGGKFGQGFVSSAFTKSVSKNQKGQSRLISEFNCTECVALIGRK